MLLLKLSYLDWVISSFLTYLFNRGECLLCIVVRYCDGQINDCSCFDCCSLDIAIHEALYFQIVVASDLHVHVVSDKDGRMIKGVSTYV